MLDGAFNVDERSRLCCQIIMSKELDGLEVELAPESLARRAGRAVGGGELAECAPFPIFVSFDRKPPLVVGGGELAAVKTRLLLKRAPSSTSPPMMLVPGACRAGRSGPASRSLPPRPGVDQVRGRPLVIAATEDDEEDARVVGHRPRAWRAGQCSGPARALHLRACRPSSIAAR